MSKNLVSSDTVKVRTSGNSVYLDSNIYSTTEQVVGTWIDGKPLYRKIIEGQLGDPISHHISNANFVKVYGLFKTDNGNFFPLPDTRPNYPEYGCGLYANSTQVVFDKGSSLSNNDCIIILEYTKTTD